jgi:integrase/recombinase XerD
MAQAKTLISWELEQVLMTIAKGRYAARDRAMVLISFWSGMRVGEIAALKIGDVLTSDGRIKDEIRLKPEQTKGSKARNVMLGSKIRDELSIYIGSLNTVNLDSPLFCSQKSGNHFNANALTQKFRQIYDDAGIDGATSHSGRRTFITQLASKGIGVRVLQSLAGHRSIATTQLYIDVNDEMKRQAVNMI